MWIAYYDSYLPSELTLTDFNNMINVMAKNMVTNLEDIIIYSLNNKSNVYGTVQYCK